jgi:type II secretory pathway pseudopilin PulG
MSLLVLIVLAAIVLQLFIGTTTGARVARNELTLVAMDQAIESALLEVYDRLIQDGEADLAAGAQGAAEGGAGIPPTGPAEGGAGAGSGDGQGGQSQQPVDSREDSWGRPQRSTINEIELRILVQDEDSKLNVLGLLTEDPEQRDRWLDRVVRVIDFAREGTGADIDPGMARRLAETLREHLQNRSSSALPRPQLLSDDEERRDQGVPLSLQELAVLEPFEPHMFRDFRDEGGRVVHSLGSFLTVYTSVEAGAPSANAPDGGGAGQAPSGQAGSGGGPGAPSGSDAGGNPAPEGSGAAGAGGAPQGGGSGNAGSGGQGSPSAGGGGAGGTGGAGATTTNGARGVAVNVNTAPAAVLKALVDTRDVPYRFWDEVLEYRNLEEKPKDGEEPEPVYDEFGEEVIERQVFDSLEELSQINGWDRLNGEQRALLAQLLTTQSHVFTVCISARRATGRSDDFGGALGIKPSVEEEERERALQIVRTVRSVVWRYQDGDTLRILPLVRWDVIEYTPFEVLDFPDEDR